MLKKRYLMGIAALGAAVITSWTTEAATVLYGTRPMLSDSIASFADAARPQYFADDFMFAAGGDYHVTELRWWGRYFEPGNVGAITGEGDDNFFLTLFNDTGTGPEASPWLERELGAVARTQVAQPGGVPIFGYHLVLSEPIRLAGGQRHFYSIHNDNGINDPQFGMLWATPSSFSDPRWWRTSETAAWNRTGFNTAFEFIGNPVPEPATVGILGLGLAGIALRRRFGKSAGNR